MPSDASLAACRRDHADAVRCIGKIKDRAAGEVYAANRGSCERLDNQGTYSPEEYEDLAVHNLHHPLDDEFLEVLRHPNLSLPQMILDPGYLHHGG